MHLDNDKRRNYRRWDLGKKHPGGGRQRYRHHEVSRGHVCPSVASVPPHCQRENCCNSPSGDFSFPLLLLVGFFEPLVGFISCCFTFSPGDSLGQQTDQFTAWTVTLAPCCRDSCHCVVGISSISSNISSTFRKMLYSSKIQNCAILFALMELTFHQVLQFPPPTSPPQSRKPAH